MQLTSTERIKHSRYPLNRQHPWTEEGSQSADLPDVPAQTGTFRRSADLANTRQQTAAAAVTDTAGAFEAVAGIPTTSPRAEDCNRPARELLQTHRRLLRHSRLQQPQKQSMSVQERLPQPSGLTARQRPNEHRAQRFSVGDAKRQSKSRIVDEHRRQVRPLDIHVDENVQRYLLQERLELQGDRRYHEQQGQASNELWTRHHAKFERKTKMMADQRALLEGRAAREQWLHTERREDAELRRLEEMARVRREITFERRRQAIIENQVNARQKMRQSRRQTIEAQRRQAVAVEQRRWQRQQQAELVRRQNRREEADLHTGS
jgi:hypothetical protein